MKHTIAMVSMLFLSSLHAMEGDTSHSLKIELKPVTKDNLTEISQQFPSLECFMAESYLPYYRNNRKQSDYADQSTKSFITYNIFQLEVNGLYANHPIGMYIAHHDKDLVGMVSFNGKENTICLRHVIVDQKYRHKGIGKKLSLLPLKCHKNVTKIIIQCPRRFHDSIQFFKNINFQENNSVLELLHPDEYVGLEYKKENI